MKQYWVCAVVLCSILLITNRSWSDCQPRDHIPAPPGCSGILLYYCHAGSDALYNDGRKVDDDLDFSQDLGIVRLVHYWSLSGFTCYSNVLIPFGEVELEDSPLGRDVHASGFADPIFQSGIFFYNDTPSKTWAAFSSYVYFPIGDYDNDGALSLGTHQWRFREECGFVKGFGVWSNHDAYFELILAVDLFTDNDEFGPLNRTKSTDPILTLESHLSYDLSCSAFASVDYYYHRGGETEISQFNQNDALSNHTLGCSFAYNITRHFQIMVQYLNDIDVKSGLKSQSVMTRVFYNCDLGYLFGNQCRLNK